VTSADDGNVFNRFKRRSRSAATVDQIKSLVREMMRLDEADVVSVTEITCADPQCAGPETIVLVMRDSKPTQALKFLKGIADLSPDDVRQGCASAVRPSS
jgi:hypothetical protein